MIKNLSNSQKIDEETKEKFKKLIEEHGKKIEERKQEIGEEKK